MSEATTKLAPADPTQSDAAVVVECELDAPPAKVWRALAEPDIRAEWLGEPDAGRSALRCADPPGRLDLAWPTKEGESLISFEINPSVNGGSHLTITHHAPTACVIELRPPPSIVSGSGPWRMAA